MNAPHTSMGDRIQGGRIGSRMVDDRQAWSGRDGVRPGTSMNGVWGAGLWSGTCGMCEAWSGVLRWNLQEKAGV